MILTARRGMPLFCFRMLAVILLSDFVYYFSGGFKEKSKSVTCVKNSITLIDFDML